MMNATTICNASSLSVADRRGPVADAVDDFNFISILGKGSYGKVLKVQHRGTGRTYALKAIKKEPKTIVSCADEASIMRNLAHPYIVPLHASFETEGFHFLLLDHLPGQNILSELKGIPEMRFGEQRAKEYIAQIGLALTHLHREHNVIHRDVKADNIMLDSRGRAVLIDFGLSTRTTPGVPITSTCGTLAYLAPEVLKGLPKGYGHQVDWWSLGIVAYVMLTGCYPFLRPSKSETASAIVMNTLVYPSKVSLSSEAKSFLQRILEKDPARRLQSAEELRSHPWMSTVDFEALLPAPAPKQPQTSLFNVFNTDAEEFDDDEFCSSMGYTGSDDQHAAFDDGAETPSRDPSATPLRHALCDIFNEQQVKA